MEQPIINDQLRAEIRQIVREELNRHFNQMAQAQCKAQQDWIDKHTPNKSR